MPANASSISLEDVLGALHYTGSPNYLTGDALRLDPNYGHILRKAQEACKLQGVYTLRASAYDPHESDVPVVYVCRAESEKKAREIHRSVWNQNTVPFLLVVSPGSVRLYPGFSYKPASGEDPNVGALRAISDFNKVATELAPVRGESIDSGLLWKEWGRYVAPDSRVDWRLLDNLRALDNWLLENGVEDRGLSHAVIGKFVYLRYLRQRNILSDAKLSEWKISYDEALTEHAQISSFTDLVQRLDEWLNGSVFPLSRAEIQEFGAERLRQVASVFSGGTAHGQLPLFEIYDFSLIPIETLSVIYEQFLHALRHPSAKSEGAARGAYYTPVPLVNFMVDRLDSRKPLKPGMRVLDPACGSGAFLVQCYRKLIERRLASSPRRPRPAELGNLLTQHIFGIDIDPDACQIAELSLSLTLLEYVDPPDLTATEFKLPPLRNRNIFCADTFAEHGEWQSLLQRQPVDWVIGNPPWKELNPNRLDDTDRPALHWMGRNRSEHPVGGNQMAEAFAWRAAHLVGPEAVVGLLLPAMTLFKYESKGFREAFLKQNQLWCVANFANLAEVLFAGRARLPAAAFFYSRKAEQLDLRSGHETVEVYSPFLATQPAAQGRGRKRVALWNLVVDSCDRRELTYSELLNGSPQPWKLAMWGSAIDQKLLARVEAQFRTFGNIEKDGLLVASQGLELRRRSEAKREPTEQHAELAGMLALSVEPLKKRRYLFRFAPAVLQPLDINDTFVSLRAGFSRRFGVCMPPHVLVGASRNFAVYTEDPIVVPSRQIGVTSPQGNKPLLKALALYLNSDFVAYHQFLSTTQAGIQKTVNTLRALRLLPIPFEDGGRSLSEWESLYSRIVTQTAAGDDFDRPDLVGDLNELTFQSLRLGYRARAAIHDLLHVRLALNQGKIGDAAVRAPSTDDLKAYAGTLRNELDAFVGGKLELRHRVDVVSDGGSGLAIVEIVNRANGHLPVRVMKATDEAAGAFAEARSRLTERHAQWLYFRRNLRVYEASKTYILKSLHRLEWTQTQAMQDAGDIIAESIRPELVDSERVVG